MVVYHHNGLELDCLQPNGIPVIS